MESFFCPSCGAWQYGVHSCPQRTTITTSGTTGTATLATGIERLTAELSVAQEDYAREQQNTLDAEDELKQVRAELAQVKAERDKMTRAIKAAQSVCAEYGTHSTNAVKRAITAALAASDER